MFPYIQGGEFVDVTAITSMTPHVLNVKPGENVVAKIFTFLQKYPRAAVRIISAVGTVSSVVLRQPGVSGDLLRYEGQFEILTLRGSWDFTKDAAGVQSKMTISLAKPDGSVFDGDLESSMVAATHMILVLGTYKPNTRNQTKRKFSSSTAQNMFN